MVHLLFKGARFDYLKAQCAEYGAAVAAGTTKEFVDVVYARYARRFPIELSLDEDPAPEFLASIDDEAPEPESENESRLDDLSPEELEAERQRISDRQGLIQKRRKQITAWFHYKHMKQRDVDPRSTDPSNPFTALLFSVTGVRPSDKPRQKSAVNCWSKSQAAAINQLVRQQCIAQNVGRKNSMAVWNKIAKEEFAKLPEDKQRFWARKAKEDHKVEIDQWKASKEMAISTKPEDRQCCIEGIVRLGQEFLDKLAEATGWKWTLIGGGPEPVSEGRLTVISLHGGTTNGEAPLNFGQKERDLYLSQILPVFSKFLRACYTPEECRSRALASVDAIPLEDVGLEDIGMSFDLASSPEVPVNANLARQPSTSLSTSSPTVATSMSIAPPPPPSIPAVTTPSDANPLNQGPEAEPEHQPQPRMPSPPPSVVPTPLGSPVRSPSRRGHSISPMSSPVAASGTSSTILNASAMRPALIDTNTTSSALVSANAAHQPSVNGSASDVNPIDTNTIQSTSIGTNTLASAPINPSTQSAPAIDTENPLPSPPVDASTSVTAQTTSPAAQALSAATSTSGSTTMVSGTRGSNRKRQAPAPRDEPPSKRRREPPSATPASSAPSLHGREWFQKALAMLKTDSLGTDWTNLVQAWVCFEEASNDSAPGSLHAKGRPAAVGKWINVARRPNYKADIHDSKAFGDQHVAWWASLQPDWRLSDPESVDGNDNSNLHDDADYGLVRGEAALLRNDDGDMEELRQPGVNGLLSVLASLYFWGTAVKNSGKKSRQWSRSVDDCIYILDRLAPPA